MTLIAPALLLGRGGLSSRAGDSAPSRSRSLDRFLSAAASLDRFLSAAASSTFSLLLAALLAALLCRPHATVAAGASWVRV